MLMRLKVALAFIVLLAGCSSTRGVYHKVLPGQTLYRISKTYQVDERYLARINDIHDPTQLRAGEVVFIPGATRVRSVSSTSHSGNERSDFKRASKGSAPTRVPRQAASKSPVTSSPEVAKISQNAGSNSSAPPPAKGKFIYPVKGQIVKGFGEKAGELSKGLEIAAQSGTPVISSAAGQVIYSGDGVKGYGNLIILKHDGSFYTVYGFNKKNLVNAGSFVGQGEKIALSGTPPRGGQPRLHFEIRHGKKAVNPIFYLP